MDAETGDREASLRVLNDETFAGQTVQGLPHWREPDAELVAEIADLEFLARSQARGDDFGPETAIGVERERRAGSRRLVRLGWQSFGCRFFLAMRPSRAQCLVRLGPDSVQKSSEK